jgi:2,5-diketo-D-gluconate reductase A
MPEPIPRGSALGTPAIGQDAGAPAHRRRIAAHMSAQRSPAVTIDEGVEMPLVGLGTWEASNDEVYGAVLTAFEVGYRHIDTATMYRNEAGIGRAIAASGLARDELFVTTKLLASDAGRERELIARSLEALQLEQVDLWLIHWPPSGDPLPATWQAFIEARNGGQTRAIGVSNYSAAQIDALMEATGVTPAVNQIRWAPALYDAEVVSEHRARGVVLEGYSPFKETDLDDPVLAEIAAAHGVTPPQVVLRWHLEHGVVVIPKSSDPGRIAANFDVFGFQLDADEVARIDALAD